MDTTDNAGWDCHAHLFGPYERFPLAADRSYTPPEALRDHYLALLARLGLSNGVLVHPSAYGDDYSLLFDALAELPQLRGVIVARPGTLPSLKGLRDKGIRALRYSHRSGAGNNFAGSASFDDLLQMAPTLADAGLHAELWTDCKVLPDISAQLKKLPVPVVIDHMGGFDVGAGVNEAGFQTLLSLVESGAAWVKLCAYRNLFSVQDPELGRPFHEALLRANPQQLVWGSDWPHLRVTPEPDTAQLLDTFKRWTTDTALAHRILQDNPQRLYG
ncbi:MAG: amidohydrolase family protein [Polaromonas sp.]|uniref:amidohydrolase family protein n=1 Tax=Polaromonas sp. TaxID=1869339 RepID=UPI0025E168A4|nr:amidohydrolase family protein [Polaromonas sp.]MBI2726887.1 amidohydrolase family protein [Polaromonas sp.]